MVGKKVRGIREEAAKKEENRTINWGVKGVGERKKTRATGGGQEEGQAEKPNRLG